MSRELTRKTSTAEFRIRSGRLSFGSEEQTPLEAVEQALSTITRAVQQQLKADPAPAKNPFVGAYIPPTILHKTDGVLGYNQIRIGVAHALGFHDPEEAVMELAPESSESPTATRRSISLHHLTPDGTPGYTAAATLEMEAWLEQHAKNNELLGQIHVTAESIEALPRVRSTAFPLKPKYYRTANELVDAELLRLVGAPRTHVTGDYQGPTGVAAYRACRLQLGFIDHYVARELSQIAPGEAMERVLAGKTGRRLAIHAAVIGGYVDRLYKNEAGLKAEIRGALPAVTQELAAIVQGLEESADLRYEPQDLLACEHLRYALWTIRKIDLLLPFLEIENCLWILSEAHPYMLAAFNVVGRSPSLQNDALDALVREHPDFPVLSPPNAIRLQTGFEWTDKYRTA